MKKRNLRLFTFLLLCVFTANIYAQQQVNGVISDTSGIFLPGVSVVLKGTPTGVTSDFDGNYSITIPNKNSILVFSYLGMQTQ